LRSSHRRHARSRAGWWAAICPSFSFCPRHPVAPMRLRWQLGLVANRLCAGAWSMTGSPVSCLLFSSVLFFLPPTRGGLRDSPDPPLIRPSLGPGPLHIDDAPWPATSTTTNSPLTTAVIPVVSNTICPPPCARANPEMVYGTIEVYAGGRHNDFPATNHVLFGTSGRHGHPAYTAF